MLLLIVIYTTALFVCAAPDHCKQSLQLSHWIEDHGKYRNGDILVPLYVPSRCNLMVAWNMNHNKDISNVKLRVNGKQDDGIVKSDTFCQNFCECSFYGICDATDYHVVLESGRSLTVSSLYIPEHFMVRSENRSTYFKWRQTDVLATKICVYNLSGNSNYTKPHSSIKTSFKTGKDGKSGGRMLGDKDSNSGGPRGRRGGGRGGRGGKGGDAGFGRHGGGSGGRGGRGGDGGSGRNGGGMGGSGGRGGDGGFSWHNREHRKHGGQGGYGAGGWGTNGAYGYGGYNGNPYGYGGYGYGGYVNGRAFGGGGYNPWPPKDEDNQYDQTYKVWHSSNSENKEWQEQSEEIEVVPMSEQQQNNIGNAIESNKNKMEDFCQQINNGEEFPNLHHTKAIEKTTNHSPLRNHPTRNSQESLALVNEESHAQTHKRNCSHDLSSRKHTLKRIDQGICFYGKGNEIAIENLEPATPYIAVISFQKHKNLNIYFETSFLRNEPKQKATTPTVIPKSPPNSSKIPSTTMVPNSLKCPSYHSNLYPGYVWNSQYAGETVLKPCPFPASGEAVWTCNVHGKWIDSIPDFSNCTQLMNYDERANELYKPKQFYRSLWKTGNAIKQETMAPGDIVSVLKFMEEANNRLKELKKTEKSPQDPRFIDWIISTNNRLLTERKAWRGLRRDRKKATLNTIQKTVEDAALEESLHIEPNTKRVFKKSALYVEIEKYNKTHYSKKYNRKYCHPDVRFDPTCLTLPLLNETNNTISVTVTAYSTIHSLFPNSMSGDTIKNVTAKNIPNSAVMGATIGSSEFTTDTNNPVHLQFRHIFPGDRYKLENKRCAWWNETEWSTYGCQLVKTDEYITECDCYHLTNLAVIMDINGILYGHVQLMNLLQFITIIGSVVSILCLALIIILLSNTKASTSATNCIHINLCATLLISEVILLIGLDATFNATICSVIAASLFYFLLSTFCWSCIESAHIYVLYIKVFSPKTSYLRGFCLFAYIFPAIVVAISAGINEGRGFGNHKHCWLSYENHLIWAFAGPVLCILLINACIYVLTLQSLLVRGPLANRTVNGQNFRMMRASMTLSAVLYLNWGFGFLYMIKGTEIMAFVFTCLNAFQGLLLFIVIIMFNKERVDYLKKKITGIKPKNSDIVLAVERSLPKGQDSTNSSSLVVQK